jgi:hypothetical protein
MDAHTKIHTQHLQKQIKRIPMLTSLEKRMVVESGYFHCGLIDDGSSSVITSFVLIKMYASILYVHCKF